MVPRGGIEKPTKTIAMVGMRRPSKIRPHSGTSDERACGNINHLAQHPDPHEFIGLGIVPRHPTIIGMAIERLTANYITSHGEAALRALKVAGELP